MKTLIKWAVKKFASAAKLKDAIHAANAALAEKEAGERTVAVTGYCNDAAETVAAYAAAYANDGKMDEEELAAVNARCDAMIDKYASDERVETFIDMLFK